MGAITDSFSQIDWKAQEAEDTANLEALFSQAPQDQESSALNFFDDARPLDLGEKADDAIDFEDISDDDDLPEEEEATGHYNGDVPGLTDDAGTSNDTDDLFGEGRGSSPYEEDCGDEDFKEEIEADLSPDVHDVAPSFSETLAELHALNFPEQHYDLENPKDSSSAEPLESEEAILKREWPTFRKGIVLDWNELLPTKKAYFLPKTPVKPPKPVYPTKVSLDIAVDQEKIFRTAGTAAGAGDKRKRTLEAEAKGLVAILEDSSDEKSDEEDFDWSAPSRTEQLGGLSWADLEILCGDWESKINHQVIKTQPDDVSDDGSMDDWDREILGYSAKRKKAVQLEPDLFNTVLFPVPSFDDFEEDTKRIAKRPILDLNDPHLLVDMHDQGPKTKKQRLGGDFRRNTNSGFAKSLSQRFNISNDEAYDALKENHQSKVRATIGNLAVEHSLPALKLQWPYYRVKLYTRDARAFHRPSLKFNKFIGQKIEFSRLSLRKRKTLKGLSTQEVFKESKDLSLAEHSSTATLFEYSEEHPTVLSNFGMGNRVINYYRRKGTEDTDRPQPEDKVGDVTVLLPEDKSPFAIFGMVDPGETVRTLHNAMYRAPIFKHEPKNSDFLVIRNSTGQGGTSWYLRNIDHLFTVGQQFPSMEIPGPHSRKVTNAAKNRMKMIAFRKIKHHPEQHLKIGDITAHIADSTDMQNRQKLKEFIHYDKVDKVWRMKPGEPVPEEAVIRTMVKPEDVCVIDAMQVGSRHLEDAGYAAEDEDDGDDATNSLEQNLAPWRTSKAFLEAAAEKAMLVLHGEGDPSGCGMAFSLIKTSMKGGYIGAVQGPGAISANALAAERKANGGHTYNVKKQQEMYDSAIRDIWGKQKTNLTDPVEHDGPEYDQTDDERHAVGQTPRSMAGGFDDTASQFSTGSRQNRAMRVVRKVRNSAGQIEEVSEIIQDVRVWREYQKRRLALNAEKTNVYEAKPTGNPETDRAQAAALARELQRLEKNKERRQAREKQKGIFRASAEPESALSPSAAPHASVEKPIAKATGTTRKCANCGQAGHIKTNKKLCPLLNGTMKPEDAVPNNGGFGAIQVPDFGQAAL